MSGQPWRILIADDDPTAALLFRAALSAADFSIEIADNGNDALAMFHREKFDAAMLDVEMPGLDGIEVCQAIRQACGGDFPVYLITGRGDDDFLCRVRTLGAGYLPKPIDWTALPGMLRDALGATDR